MSHNNNKGVTLIEVLISIAMVGFAFIALIEMFSTSDKLGQKTKNLDVAMNLAQERVEEIKNLVRNGVLINIGTGNNTADGFLPALSNVCTDSYLSGKLFLTESNTYPSTNPSLNKMNPVRRIDRITQVTWAEGVNTYKKVQVTVFWMEKDSVTSCGLVTFIRD